MHYMNKESVVFVGAHPDDTEGYGATAFLLKDKYDIHVVDLTRGELGLGWPGLRDGSTAKRRVQEEQNACAYLGATPHFLEEIDGDAYAGKPSVDMLTDLLKELHPRAIFTHWPLDNHPDHVQTAAVVSHALARLDYSPEYYFFEVLLSQTSNFSPVYYIDVTSTIDNKAALLRNYVCQNDNDNLALEKIRQAKFRGQECVPPVGYAEVFSTFNGNPIPGGVLEPFAVKQFAPLFNVATDGNVTLPDFNENAWAFNKGYKLRGLLADECTVKNAMLPEIFGVSTMSGQRLRYDVDYKLDREWGTIGLLPNATREPVKITYCYGKARIDSVIEKDGVRSVRAGIPHVATPVPPSLKDGEIRKENIYVSLNEEVHFPILTDSSSAPRTKPMADSTNPRTIAKLRAGKPITILAWGDSVTAAVYLPEKDKWQQQFVARLRKAFPKSDITLKSNGWGGRTTKSFMEEPSGSQYNYEETVLAVKPDLIISEFVNDAGLPLSDLEERYTKILTDFKARDIEWIILTPHYVRRDWMGLTSLKDIDDDPRPYVKFIRDFTAENNVGLADAALRWGHLWREGIPYETLFVNNINHPNAFGMSFYADALMDFIG